MGLKALADAVLQANDARTFDRTSRALLVDAARTFDQVRRTFDSFDEADFRGKSMKPVSGWSAPVKACADCAHRTRFGNCGEPVLAGLRDRFEIAMAPDGYSRTCQAFKRKSS